jgi:hypothetical protein
MAERFTPLPATQVAWVRSSVPARLTISVDKLALICKPAYVRGHIASTAIALKRKKNAVAKAKMFLHLEAWVLRTEKRLQACHMVLLFLGKSVVTKKQSHYHHPSTKRQAAAFFLSFFPLHLASV